MRRSVRIRSTSMCGRTLCTTSIQCSMIPSVAKWGRKNLGIKCVCELKVCEGAWSERSYYILVENKIAVKIMLYFSTAMHWVKDTALLWQFPSSDISDTKERIWESCDGCQQFDSELCFGKRGGLDFSWGPLVHVCPVLRKLCFASCAFQTHPFHLLLPTELNIQHRI